jgi:hypothetical protein
MQPAINIVHNKVDINLNMNVNGYIGLKVDSDSKLCHGSKGESSSEAKPRTVYGQRAVLLDVHDITPFAG